MNVQQQVTLIAAQIALQDNPKMFIVDPWINIKSYLNEWYRIRAKVIFEARLQHILEQALWVENYPDIRLMTMRTQWGNCSPSGLLTLNPHLVKAPTICIDYVILHELCHLVEHNHSERFYQLLNQVMPDWSKRLCCTNLSVKGFSAI